MDFVCDNRLILCVLMTVQIHGRHFSCTKMKYFWMKRKHRPWWKSSLCQSPNCENFSDLFFITINFIATKWNGCGAIKKMSPNQNKKKKIRKTKLKDAVGWIQNTTTFPGINICYNILLTVKRQLAQQTAAHDPTQYRNMVRSFSLKNSAWHGAPQFLVS